MPGVRVSYHPRIKWRIVSGPWRGNVGLVAVGVAFQPFWEIPAVNGELDNFLVMEHYFTQPFWGLHINISIYIILYNMIYT